YEAVAYPLTLSFAAQLSAGGAAGAAAPPESPEAAESPAGTVPAAESPGAKPRGAPWAESAWALAQRAGDATSAKPSINMPMRDIEPPGVEGRGRPGRQRNALARGGARAATRSSGALRRGWAGDPVTAALRGQAAAGCGFGDPRWAGRSGRCASWSQPVWTAHDTCRDTSCQEISTNHAQRKALCIAKSSYTARASRCSCSLCTNHGSPGILTPSDAPCPTYRGQTA